MEPSDSNSAPLPEEHKQPNKRLLEFAADTLGTDEFQHQWFGWNHGEAQVWKLTVSSSANEFAKSVFLKTWRQTGKYQREVRALTEWGSPLIQQSFRVPTIVAELPGEAILMTVVPGVGPNVLKRTAEFEREMHRQAGRFLAALHRLPFDDTDIPLSDAYRQRAATWSARAESHLDAAVIRRVIQRVEEALPLLQTESRVPCHRDFSPRNWLVDVDGTVGFIDFEHARPDLRVLDFERLWSRVWPVRPDLEDAFFAGYGQRLSDSDRTLLERLAALTALSTVVWSREHNDAAFEAHGISVLQKLGLLPD